MWITTHDGKLVNLEHVMDIERRAVQSLQAQLIARFADEQEVVLARGEFADTAYNAIRVLSRTELRSSTFFGPCHSHSKRVFSCPPRDAWRTRYRSSCPSQRPISGALRIVRSR